MPPDAVAEIGVIGGSGLYSLLADAEQVEVHTPYGEPSGPVAVGTVTTADGTARSIAFVARHGAGHRLPPHMINYRANVWALHAVGVTRVLGPCAVGSLRLELRPGDVVLCDQFVDATWGRPGTFFDGPVVNHASIADPYCPELAPLVAAAAAEHGFTVHRGGTVVVIPGPRFATRAESATYRRLGYDLINMTQCPEVALCRELGMCYSAIALITDYDSGLPDLPHVAAVTQVEVLARFGADVGRLRDVLTAVLADVPARRTCRCHDIGIDPGGLTGAPPAPPG
jgi:5'-methylthioadenosine phosphorylase